MGEYVPSPGQEAGKLPGMGGVFNTVNLHVYHYAGNNPVKYTDPDGESPIDYQNYIQKIKKTDTNLNIKFTGIMNSLVGTSYKYGGTSRSGVDCSGSILLALAEMGYDIPRVSSEEMASGNIDWIKINPSVDDTKTGDIGMLNFYDLDSGSIDHVNVGVGDIGKPTPLLKGKLQVVDATVGSTLTQRQGQQGQYYKPGKNQVNQTYAPFSTNRTPEKQGSIKWEVLESKYKRADE